MKNCLIFTACLLGLVLFAAGGASAAYHSYPDIICSDCHSLHNANATANDYLLKASTTNSLCLTNCHQDTAAKPDVIGVLNSWGGVTESTITGTDRGAGWFLASGEGANANGHDLNNSAAPPNITAAGALSAIALNCASCHNPHGTSNHRNLQLRPGPASVDKTVVAYVDGTATNENKYKRAKIGYKSGLANWCASCHGSAGNYSNEAGATAHFKRHPVDVVLNTATYHTDTANWTGGAAKGFDATAGNLVRLPFQVSGATDYATATTVAATNQVFCGSCHKAHGSAFDSGLIWDFAAASTNGEKIAGCEQCHAK